MTFTCKSWPELGPDLGDCQQDRKSHGTRKVELIFQTARLPVAKRISPCRRLPPRGPLRLCLARATHRRVTVTAAVAVLARRSLSRPAGQAARARRFGENTFRQATHRQSNLCDNTPFGGEVKRKNHQQWLP